MTFTEKAEMIMYKYGLNRQSLAERLRLNYRNVAKNIQNNNLTLDFALALKREFPEIDLNWLAEEEPKTPMVIEPQTGYGDPKAALKKVRELLDVIESSLE